MFLLEKERDKPTQTLTIRDICTFAVPSFLAERNHLVAYTVSKTVDRLSRGTHKSIHCNHLLPA